MEALLTILEEYPDDYAQNNSHPKPRKGYMIMPPNVSLGRAGNPDSFGFFTKNGVEFEVLICDPRPTYFMYITTEQWATCFPEVNGGQR